MDSIEFTLDNQGASPPLEYDKFEKVIAPKFNTNYFNDLCSEFPSSGWFFTWVDKNCPAIVSSTTCSLGNNWEACNTPASAGCPSESVCDAAMDDVGNDQYNYNALDKCAYQQCRFEVLAFILKEMEVSEKNPEPIAVAVAVAVANTRSSQPVLEVLETVVYILVAMIFLTCLLICYNPADDERKQLEKTGVLVEKAPQGKKPSSGGSGSGRRRSTQNSRHAHGGSRV